jgi:hypothetical protein
MAAARTSALLCALATGALGWWWPEGSTEVDRDRNDAAAPACASPLPPSLLGLRIEPRRYTWPTRADLNVLTAAVPLSVLNCAHAKWRTPSGRAASESIVDSQPLWSMQVDRLPRLMVLASGWDGLTTSRARWRFSMKSRSVQVRSVQRCMRGTPSTHMPARHTRQCHVGTFVRFRLDTLDAFVRASIAPVAAVRLSFRAELRAEPSFACDVPSVVVLGAAES